MGWTVETLNDTVDGELADLPEKTQKTPNTEIEIARERAKELEK